MNSPLTGGELTMLLCDVVFDTTECAHWHPNDTSVVTHAWCIGCTSAPEAELVALYIMAQEAVYIRIVLSEMGHKQPATPLQMNNATTDAVCNGKIQFK